MMDRPVPISGDIKGATMDGMVTVGSWVTVRDGEIEEAWRIVPHLEADALRRHISEASPLARAVLGHRPGDTVRVMGPERRSVVVLAVNRPGA